MKFVNTLEIAPGYSLGEYCLKNFGFWNEELEFNETALKKQKVVLKHNQINYELIILNRFPQLRFSEFHRMMFLGDEKLTDDLKDGMKRVLTAVYGGDIIHPSEFTIALNIAANKRPFNPIRDYLEALPKADGNHYLDTYLTTICKVKDSPTVRMLGRKWLISAVARGVNPGCEVEGSLIFYGEQGVGKTRFFKELNISLDYYHGSEIDFGNVRDTSIALSGYHICELSELSSLKKSSLEEIKNFLTQKSDIYVGKFKSLSSNNKRGFIFGGSTNSRDILSDHQNRRFWCVESVSEVDFDELQKIKPYLWREAFDAYLAGESWFLNKEEKAALESHNEYFREDSPLRDYLIQTLYNRTTFISSADLLLLARSFDPKAHHKAISAVMLQLGWDKQQGKKGKEKGCMLYFPPKKEESKKDAVVEYIKTINAAIN